MSDTVPVKAGWKTTEFYVTIATSVSGVLTMLGYLDAQNATDFVNAVQHLAGGVLTMGTVIAYIWSRVKAKNG